MMPIWSFTIAEEMTKGEPDPNYDRVDPHAANMLIMSLVYGFLFIVPFFWGIIVIASRGRVGGKALAWMIHHWTSNLTPLLMILAAVVFGLIYMESKQEIWYISIYFAFAVSAWIVTMVLSIKAIQYGDRNWLKVAPGLLWQSLFFIDNNLDEYLEGNMAM